MLARLQLFKGKSGLGSWRWLTHMADACSCQLDAQLTRMPQFSTVWPLHVAWASHCRVAGFQKEVFFLWGNRRPNLRSWNITLPTFCWTKLQGRLRFNSRAGLYFLMGRVTKNSQLPIIYYMTFSETLNVMIVEAWSMLWLTIILYTVAPPALQSNSILIGYFCLNYFKYIINCNIFNAMGIKCLMDFYYLLIPPSF